MLMEPTSKPVAKPRSESSLMMVGFVLIVSLITLTGCGWQLSGLPSDDYLIQNFNQHRQELDKLLDMAHADHEVIRIAPDFTRLESTWQWPRPLDQLGFSEERWDEYKQLFKVTGLTNGIESSEEGSIFFSVSATGLGNGHGRDKGYVYLSDKAVKGISSLPSLDDAAIEKFFAQDPRWNGHAMLFRHLNGRWYLYIST
jgi:hypothetical protein